MKKILLTLLFAFLISLPAWATTYYVRTDGGTSTQCTGTTNAAYPGSGTGQACAFSHPFYATGWCGDYPNTCTSGAMVGGDDVIIASGTYNVGYSASWSGCSSSWPYNCAMKDLPDGTSGNHTTFKGCSSTGCGGSGRPKFTGMGRTRHGISIKNSSYVDIQSIEITDTAAMGYGHATLSGGDSDSAEQTMKWGITGLGWDNITIDDVYIHGLWHTGLYIGKGNNLSITNSTIYGNAYAGFDADVCQEFGLKCSSTCTNQNMGITGTVNINNVNIKYSGCIESTTAGVIQPSGCYNDTQSGYGEGLGSCDTGGNWNITNSNISYNGSDGLDLLYHNRNEYSGGMVTIKKSIFEGNVGNAIKTRNAVYVEDSFISSNCNFFKNKSITCPASTCVGDYNNCRAAGNAVALAFKAGDNTIPQFYNNTITGYGDVMIQPDDTCVSGTNVIAKNNIFIGGKEFNDDTINNPFGGNDKTSIFYNASVSCNATFVNQNNVCINNFKEAIPCPNTSNATVASPSNVFSGTILTGPNGYYSGENYYSQFALSSGSTARDFADESATSLDDQYDLNNFDRGASWDNGAVEYSSSGSCTADGGACSVAGTCCSGNCCGSVCTTSSCTGPTCGDNVKDTGEVCDGTDLNSQTCLSVGGGFSGGTLACNGSCSAFDTTGCVSPTCGDGVTSGIEQCDDGNVTNGDGCSAYCEIEIPGMEHLLTYTETNPVGQIDVGTHEVSFFNLDRTNSTILTKDYGASYFTDFVIRQEIGIDACESGGTTSRVLSLGLTANTATDFKNMEDNADGIELYYRCNPSTASYSLRLRINEGTPSEDIYTSSAPPTVLFVETERSGTTTTAKIYSDSSYTNLVDTLSITSGSTAYRYIHTAASYNDAISGGTLSGYIANINLGAGTPPVCGDGTRDAGETCDGSDLNSQTCSTQGFAGGGTLTCNPNCLSFNTSQCLSLSGNGQASSVTGNTTITGGCSIR